MVETRVRVEKKNIDWAFNETDLSVEKKTQVREKFKWLQGNDNNYLNPTVKQLGSFASRLHVPFGNLLLDKIPEPESIQLAFRTKENAPAQVSLNVRSIIYEMQRKQAWFKEESGYANQKLELVGIASAQQMTVDNVLAKMLNLLKLKHFNNARELLNDLRNQIAYQGVLVMQKGGVGLGTNRPLNVEEVRAFVLLDDYAPLIFLNQKDSYTARVFSLIHEFIHILRGTDELFANVDETLQEERFINEVAARFLMPEAAFKDVYQGSEISKVASYFNVSPFAAAIRAKNLRLANDVTEYSVFDMEPVPIKKEKGGNSYNTALSLNDNRYMSALVGSQKDGTLPPTKAASLLGISTKMLEKTISIFSEREVGL
ncbi:ImmA/IrrE family metallo-endopeptidase [Levilactobacillus brevis]|uniref:ImmA/IrrE family metallo-endopeptidase n=1 Tax=Levilactobacillus brevis TaxID=1580 RepID=UPI001C1EF0E0|nr:ImmA/IrrE family metallo-endopeptidase [Levilactobacillus brevis]MBU7540807.1 ImmA/IrrE family metallo-endopeptidase [Levilactobacillus brevis]MBU7560144.1 ImmA/IrrE family metallo-endopeptidase [Levilactobacillus brevis]MBU7566969.1 ImmA/IrrE family metallo-endopeptidase [Levilactobacillus brevis]MCE6011721.1 ImmA/IrrE family metallo-endopeptidase [Levilactobacillus brevis]MCE6014075.1 ImmA/IrrE family metallo-endopeptidase [Levilactobacillus brevis]